VRWNSEGVLQAAGEVSGTYTNVPGGASPYQPPVDQRKFFRLESPPPLP
jgi:hypothetical protein